jgi:7-carboxy-7-deazaguanine synthase
MRLDRNPKGSLLVHSIFNTIQGEGPFAGCAALFIRLIGCNLQCPGCDTIYTGESTQYDKDELLRDVKSRGVPFEGLIVITGGEPFRQNITPFVRLLLDDGYLVQIETNGVLFPSNDFPWGDVHLTVVVSPKTGKIHPDTARLASAYKYVLQSGDVAPDGLPIHALGHPLGTFPHVARPPVGWEGPVYLQPMDEQDDTLNALNAQAVVRSVLSNKQYIMGVQMHKLTNLP